MWGWSDGMMMRVCDHHVRASMIIILSDDKIIIKNIMTSFFFSITFLSNRRSKKLDDKFNLLK